MKQRKKFRIRRFILTYATAHVKISLLLPVIGALMASSTSDIATPYDCASAATNENDTSARSKA